MRSARASRRSTLGLLSLILAQGLAAASLQAQERRLTLEPDGTVYRLLQGSYGELFPDGTATDPEHPVLALEVLPASGEPERWVVPGTESWDPESSPSLVYEKSTRRLFLLWQQLFNGIHPLFYLLSFDGAEWSDLVQITSGPFTDKGSLQLAVTREDAVDGGGRTLVQLVWWEEAPNATNRKRYAPIFLEDGVDIDASRVFDLSVILPAAPQETPPPEAVGLEYALSFRSGRNDHTEVVGFLDPDSQRLFVLDLELLPAAVSNLAERVRGHIVIVGSEFPTRGELAESISNELLVIGTDFHPATLRYLDHQIRQIVNSPDTELTPGGIQNLADGVRGHIVIVGSRIGNGGLDDGSDSEILTIGPSVNGGYHNLKVSKVFDRAAPDVGGAAQLLLSESGRKVLVAWEEGEDRIHYTESLEEGWSEPGVIELTEELDRETVYRMLEDRVRTD